MPNQIWVLSEARGFFRSTFRVGLCSATSEPRCSFTHFPEPGDIFQQLIAAHILRRPTERSVVWLEVIRGRGVAKDGNTMLLRCTASSTAPIPQCTSAAMLEY